ncbi:MAG: tetratricopeptide repeat-containing sensor histidine kinase [Bacteroidota bacterium]
MSPRSWAQETDATVERIISLIQQSSEQNDLNEMIRLARSAYQLADSESIDSLTLQSSRLLGRAYFFASQYDSSTYFTQASISSANRMGDDIYAAKGYNNLGLIYMNLGNIPAAIENLQQSLEIKERLGDELGMAATYANMGRAYVGGGIIEQPAEALPYFKRAVEIRRKLESWDRIPLDYVNLSEVYLLMDSLNAAYALIQESLALTNENPESRDHVNSLRFLGGYFLEIEDYAKALDNLMQALQIAEQISYINQLPAIHLDIAKAYHGLGSYEAALKYARLTYPKASQSGEERETVQVLASIFEDLNQTDSAIYYHKVAFRKIDSAMSAGVQKALLSLEASVAAAENRRQIEERDREIVKRKTQNLFLIITLALAITLGAVLWNRYNIKRRTSDELSLRNKEILAQKEEIESQRSILEDKNQQLEDAQRIIRNQNTELTNVNAQLEQKVRDRTTDLKEANENLKIAIQDLDRFIYKTSHDIRGPLARLMGLCSLALLDVKDDKSLQYFNMLDITAKSLNTVLVRLITIHEINNSKLNTEMVSFDKVKQEVEESLGRLDGTSQVKIEWHLPDFEFESDFDLLLLIINNLVENGVKFRDTSLRHESFVKVNIREEDNNLLIDVEDNGIGIDNEEKGKLHKMFTRSVENYEITGLGLYLVKLSVEKLQGSVGMVDNPEGVTCMRVILPMQYSELRISV